MKIIMATHYGFCFGVKRAVQIVFNEKNKQHVYMLGDLLHNPQFIERLESYNIKKINSVDLVDQGTIIIRAHGETSVNIKKATKKNLKIIDATCPKVKKVHLLTQKLSDAKYQIVIFGDKNHPEVIAIASYAQKPIIINTLDEAKKIKQYKKIGLVSQTTNQYDTFRKIENILKHKAIDFKSYNTICDATQKRQDAAKALAPKTDIMIVIGGKNSSNTQKLVAICKKITPTHHIETSSELKSSWFKNKKVCGITAGASTPAWIIDDIVKQITKY